MNGIPSLESSPVLAPAYLPSSSTRKRQRSQSMQSSSSSKRSPSEPARDGPTRDEMSSLTIDDADNDVDAYMAEQGEAEDDDSPFTPHLTPERLTFVKTQLEQTKMVAGAYWYLVSRAWWKRWEKSCTGEIDKEGGVQESEVGPVDNSSLLDEQGNLINPLEERVDVYYVPGSVWHNVIKWYGTPKPEHVLRRRVIERGEMHKEAVLELWPLALKAYRVVTNAELPNIGSRTITISSQETVKALRSQIKKAFEADSYTVPYRVWRIEADNFDMAKAENRFNSDLLIASQPKLLKDADTKLEDAMINPGDIFAIEFAETDEWTRNAAQLSISDETEPVTAQNEPKPPMFGGNNNFFNRLETAIVKRPSSPVKVPVKTYTSVRSKACEPGTLGLGNMGNTCFMNSALQCLAHTKELSDYFLTGVYREELNPENPLGMQGAIAEQFGALLHRIWDKQSTSSSYSPREFKSVLQRFAPQFSGYQQHDSQELVAFLLDGLHEDLNRVLKKPYVEKPDWEGGGDLELAQLAKKSWDGYMLRNDSVIVDLFQGQYQSTLVCPECQKVSITFDPFMYLTLPLPVTKKWRHNVYFIPWDNQRTHIELPVEIGRDASMKDLRQLLGKWLEVPPDNLLTLEIWKSGFYKNLTDATPCGDVAENDILACFELPCHAQQSRTYKPHPDDPFILPVHLYIEGSSSRSYMGSNMGFGYPFIAVVSKEEAKSQDRIYEVVVERLSRWTDAASDLYSYEAGEVAQVPINLSAGQPMDTITEFKENGEVVTLPDLPDEGDIVDQKSVVMEDIETVTPSESVLSAPMRIGAKKSVFELGISPNHSDYGAGAQMRAFQTVNWEDRANDSNEPLLHTKDVLICTFDANIRDYFFGSPPSYERARWENWQRYTHPEYEASVAATASKKKAAISLQECLDEFTREEELGEEDLWYCPRCKKHQQAKKRFDLWKTPDVLVVHLKRFSNTRSMRDKIDTLVDFPTEGLDLSNMIGERKVRDNLVASGVSVEELGMGGEDESAIYDLFGVDEHLGGLGGGHYRAYAYNHETDKWYHFDDSYVTESNASDSVNTNAYLLFYRRRSSNPLGGKSHEKVEVARTKPATENTSAIIVDAHLPTPPNETSTIGHDKAFTTARESRSPYSRYAVAPFERYDRNTPSPTGMDELPSFDYRRTTQLVDLAGSDSLDTSLHQFDFPNPSSTHVSPGSSRTGSPPPALEAESWSPSTHWDNEDLEVPDKGSLSAHSDVDPILRTSDDEGDAMADSDVLK